MKSLVEVTDPRHIARAITLLRAQLSAYFIHDRPGKVTAQSGVSELLPIRFHHLTRHSIGWAEWTFEDRQINFFVSLETPDSSAKPYDIDMELNFPKKGLDRRVNGFFVRDTTSDSVFVAHRGVFNRHGAIPKTWTFKKMTALGVKPREVMIGNQLEPAFVLGIVDGHDQSTPKRIASFVRKVKLLKAHYDAREDNGRPRLASQAPQTYTPEFHGTSTKSASERFEVEHGAIIEAIHRKLAGHGCLKVINSQAIDLRWLSPDTRRLHVLELKTGIDSQSLYTGIGQLMVHGEQLASRRATTRGRPVFLLLLPKGRLKTPFQAVLDKQGFWVARYWKVGSSYETDLLRVMKDANTAIA